MLVISQPLLVNQTAAADAKQPGLTSPLSGVQVPAPGVAATNCAKLGLLQTVHYVRWNDGAIQGSVAIEAAQSINEPGNWTLLATVSVSDSATPAPRTDSVPIVGSYAAYRHRITQMVVGGSVTTKITGAT